MLSSSDIANAEKQPHNFLPVCTSKTGLTWLPNDAKSSFSLKMPNDSPPFPAVCHSPPMPKKTKGHTQRPASTLTPTLSSPGWIVEVQNRSGSPPEQPNPTI